MKPDTEIEDQAIDFFIDENLTPDDQEYLLDVISKDPQLEKIVDMIIIRAAENTDEGIVEGPGDGNDDEVPSRVSAGEFIFSAPAVKVIGVATLEAMHEQAKQQASQAEVPAASAQAL